MIRILTILASFIAGIGITLNAQTMTKEEVPQNLSAFPVGGKNLPEYSQYFIGQSYLAPLTKNPDLNCPVSNVTFEPGCRNNWHSHTGGQLLIAVGGKGFYQEKGQPARLLLPGDIVEIAPNVVHWHGAAPDSWFSHLAITCNPQDNKSTWLEPVDDEQYLKATAAQSLPTTERLNPDALATYQSVFAGSQLPFASTDPELAKIFGDFAYGEVARHGSLDTRTRIMVIMASSVAQQAKGVYRRMLDAAFANGITPVEIKEILYQAVPYAGMAKVFDFIALTNDYMTQRGVVLPLAPQATVTAADRMEKGLALQKGIFGDAIDNNYKTSPANQLHIQEYLSANCFGDYQTRTGLNTKTRELLTFAMLVSLGGCEPQVKGHIAGNLNVGNDKLTLLDTVTALLPFIGYPRTLNAIACLNAVVPEQQ